MSKTETATKPAPKPAKKGPETIYVNDPDGKKFYEMIGHDAMTLTNGDLLVRDERVVMVKDVRKKHTRGGVDWTVILDSGFVFDPRDESVRGISENMRSIRFWRPRAGF